LWELVTKPFAILQTTFEDSDSESSENEDGEEEEQKKIAVADPEKEKKDTFDRLQAEKAELDLPGRAEFKRNSIIWKGLLRSKGQLSLLFLPRLRVSFSLHDQLQVSFGSQVGLTYTENGLKRDSCSRYRVDRDGSVLLRKNIGLWLIWRARPMPLNWISMGSGEIVSTKVGVVEYRVRHIVAAYAVWITRTTGRQERKSIRPNTTIQIT
jgi:hypothetical protein